MLTKILREKIQDIVVAFRIVFNTHVERLQNKFIGNGDDHVTTIHVLDMPSKLIKLFRHSIARLIPISLAACFMPEHSEFENISDICKLTSYLTSCYLPLLAKAGHHVIYSLPDFDNLAVTTSYIDYSFLREDSIIVDKIYDVNAKDINMYLRGLWFQAYSYVLENGARENNIIQTFLSEMRIPVMDSNEKLPLKLVLGPMQVRLLCSKELILDINFQEAHILEDNKEWYVCVCIRESCTDISPSAQLNQ